MSCGEVMDALHLARDAGLEPSENAWRVQQAMMEFLEPDWHLPDEGIWEMRGPHRHFTHSKVMAWVAADRAVKGIEHFHLDGPLNRWRRLRQEIHEQVCREGFDPELNAFVLGRSDLLFVGDCKMAAHDTRAFIALAGDYYLCPLPQVQLGAGDLDEALESVWSGEQVLTSVLREPACTDAGLQPWRAADSIWQSAVLFEKQQ